ncbi:MAG: DUF6265 family protein [Flavihumibacter sp.]|nr:DUF6265 family protein [Flavihumibacter sp.]
MYKLITILVFLGSSIIAAAQTPKLSDCKWLLGSWQAERRNGMVTESWQQQNDSTFTATSYRVNAAGEKKLLEQIVLSESKGRLFYIPTANGQNNNQPVRFEVTQLTKESFVAENALHDFPKRITYKKISADSLYACVDGGAADAEKKIEFNYTRQKN